MGRAFYISKRDGEIKGMIEVERRLQIE